ncbi:MAG: ParB/RepB/Spo0J family partition protein [Clostridiales Family XIII bacterium]|jgi:ParB family chromosome partitioning protein|nr:ParB/RepB/Spo0J family partition protein [Clostridiales Family XIII bacterium]
MKETIKNIPIADLYPFPDNPFSVREDTELSDSIRDYGVISPLVVRSRAEGGYEIISGHRRRAACEAARIEAVPAFVRELDDTAAVIALVDSNLHREHVLPSEKAHAYKLKLDAIKHQGVACGQSVHKSRDEIADSESGRQVQRYIRLCELMPPILSMVDEGKIAFSPAVELSYLPKKEQENLLETMESEDRTPSHAQAIRMRKLSADGQLDMDRIFRIMTEDKPNQKEQIKLKAESIQQFFPKGYSPRQMQETIMRLLAEWQLKREKAARNRDSR